MYHILWDLAAIAPIFQQSLHHLSVFHCLPTHLQLASHLKHRTSETKVTYTPHLSAVITTKSSHSYFILRGRYKLKQINRYDIHLHYPLYFVSSLCDSFCFRSRRNRRCWEIESRMWQEDQGRRWSCWKNSAVLRWVMIYDFAVLLIDSLWSVWVLHFIW